MKWYVLRASGGKEKKAAEYLRKEIDKSGLGEIVGQVLVPVKNEVTTRNGKRVQTERLLFPGYVLIQCEHSPMLDNIIRNNVPGLGGFLSEVKTEGSQIERIPVPIRDEEVDKILGIQDENSNSEAQTIVNFEVGESVKITDGPFAGFNGVIEEILEDRSKVKVGVVIFGRKTGLELSFTQVTKE